MGPGSSHVTWIVQYKIRIVGRVEGGEDSEISGNITRRTETYEYRIAGEYLLLYVKNQRVPLFIRDLVII